MKAWQTFILKFNGKALFLHNRFISSDNLQLFTDAASTRGFAAVFGKKWFYGDWSFLSSDYHISVLELFPIVLALELWGHLLKNHKVVFFSDNEAVVYVIQKKTSHCKHMMRLLRRLVLVALYHNVEFTSKNVPGKKNVVADSLSRFDVQGARKLSPGLEPSPQTIPNSLLHI